MKVSALDRVFNRVLRLCRGLHYGKELGTDTRGRKYRDCLICGHREFVASDVAMNRIQETKNA